jgi:hypothetical protein
MELKQNKLFKCDECNKTAEGGESYYNMPNGWNYCYFNNLGGSDNDLHHYCSITCFEEKLDSVLFQEKKQRMEQFITNH